AALSEVSRDVLLSLIDREASWLRAAALGVLGQSRDPAHAPVYLQHLRDRSDRVINAAALALGRSGSPLAYEALLQLPRHPSWKNQSLISALAGLKELGDPRAADLALLALGDVQSPRWTLATPIWDYRIAAAQLLASLGQGGRGLELVQRHLDQALAAGEINDIFSNLLLLATLADDKALAIFAALKPRWAGAAAGDAAAARALQQYETQLREALKAP
ncbi:MAG TPA: HEAT repeat domain-containing protein, partial [Rubrivivax sp.]|nr:HEAT repeat domain-containing protein [Rubrivivax sp.]